MIYIFLFISIFTLPFFPSLSYLISSITFLSFSFSNNYYFKSNLQTNLFSILLGISSFISLAAINLSPELFNYYHDLQSYYTNYLSAVNQDSIVCTYGKGMECILPIYNFLLTKLSGDFSILNYGWMILIPSAILLMMLIYLISYSTNLSPFLLGAIASTTSIENLIQTPRSSISVLFLYLLFINTVIFRKSIIKYILIFLSTATHTTAPLFILLYNIRLILKPLNRLRYFKYYGTTLLISILLISLNNFTDIAEYFISSSLIYYDKLVYYTATEGAVNKNSLDLIKNNLKIVVLAITSIVPVVYLSLIKPRENSKIINNYNQLFTYKSIEKITYFSLVLISLAAATFIAGVNTLGIRLVQPIIIIPALPIIISMLFYPSFKSFHNIVPKLCMSVLFLISLKNVFLPPEEFWFNYPIFSIEPFYYFRLIFHA